MWKDFVKINYSVGLSSYYLQAFITCIRDHKMAARNPNKPGSTGMFYSVCRVFFKL